MAPEHSAFAASGEEAITRALDIQVDTTSDELTPSDFDEFYDISRTAEEIINGGYKRIALQFPDELLHVSVPIYRRLKANIGEGRELYVLADTSYGRQASTIAVAAQHVDAHAVVHYGHACLTQTSRLPVIYVFGHKAFNISACIVSVAQFFQQHEAGKPEAILLKHDVGYTHMADALRSQLEVILNPLGIKTLYEPISTKTLPTSNSSESVISQEVSSPSSSNPAILYIGGESITLTNLLMTYGLSEVFSYDSSTHVTGLASTRTNRLLMRRYAAVQRARDADVFGILVGTLGVSSYLPLIRHLRALLARNRKKSYTISVGKLNPSKLANFLEIECFVLVACPENSVIEAKEFLRPIITPFELEIALQSTPNWTGRYILNFESILADAPGASAGDDEAPDEKESGSQSEEDGQDLDQPVFSLITGTYRHAKRYGTGGELSLHPITRPSDFLEATDTSGPISGTDSAVILRNQDDAVAKLSDSAAGMFLQTRTYQGLETRAGEDAPSVLEQGQSGIARGYRDVDHNDGVKVE
ncbi:hypothetical protein DXG01_008651 [Tephrocybe rancida]|nr:hypothetical protein DXG01_008651 [Tephrocybe rancida]